MARMVRTEAWATVSSTNGTAKPENERILYIKALSYEVFNAGGCTGRKRSFDRVWDDMVFG